MSILTELKRRKMLQVAAVYLVVAWLTMQVVDVIFTPLRLPEWFPTVVIVLLAIGFPLALIISWAFNVTPAGVVRESGAAQPQSTTRTIEFVLIGLVGVAVLWLIYRTEFNAPPASEAVVAEETAPDVRPNSIAVLPFANLSPDPDDAFFAAGIHDSILNELAKISDMHVISRTTMMRYAETGKTMPEIAEELRVKTVMEGSVQYANGRVLVTAQLIDPRSDAHLWSENYDRDFSDIFAIQAEIATRIAEAMQTELSPEDRQNLGQQMTDSPEAYSLYMQAMELAYWDLSPGDNHPGFHRLLDRAIELDPSFARAFATKAHVYSNGESTIALAMEYAEKALELDPELGLTHDAFGSIYYRQNRIAEARESYATALRISPNDPNILDSVALFHAQIGEADDAFRIANRLLEMDPGWSWTMQLVALYAGDLDAARAAARQTVKYDSRRFTRQLMLAVLEHQAGNLEAAELRIRIAEDLGDRGNSPFPVAGRTYMYGLLGDVEKANQYFEQLTQYSQTEYKDPNFVRPAWWAIAYMGIGDYDKALEYVHAAADEIENGWIADGIYGIANNNYRNPKLETPEFVEARQRLISALNID